VIGTLAKESLVKPLTSTTLITVHLLYPLLFAPLLLGATRLGPLAVILMVLAFEGGRMALLMPFLKNEQATTKL
jgi:hypothetical protein